MSTKSIASALVKNTGVRLSTTRINESELTPEGHKIVQLHAYHDDQGRRHRHLANFIDTHINSIHQSTQHGLTTDVKPSNPVDAVNMHAKSYLSHHTVKGGSEAPKSEADDKAFAASEALHSALLNAHKAHMAASLHHETQAGKHRHDILKHILK